MFDKNHIDSSDIRESRGIRLEELVAPVRETLDTVSTLFGVGTGEVLNREYRS